MNDDGYFQTRLSYEPSRDKVWHEVVAYLQRYVEKRWSLLELGAGYCGFINQIQCAEKHALDLRETFTQFAAPGVTTHVMSCVETGRLPANTFDLVFASFLFEHLDFEEMDQTMQGIKQVLKPRGRLMVLQPNFRYAYREYFDDYTHKRIFTHVSLADYFAAQGFTNRVVVPRFIPYSFKSRLPKIPALVKLYLRSPLRPLGKNMLIVADLLTKQAAEV